MGSRLSSSERGRPEQCRLLVQPRRQARLPRTTRCGVAEHRNSFAEIVTAAVTIRVITASFDQMGALGRASGKRSSVRLLSFLLRVPQMQIGAKQLCKKLHILQKLSFLTTQTKGLASVQDGRAEWSYVEHGPLLSNFCELPVAVVFLRCSSHLLLFGPWFISLCAPPPDFAHLLTAANHGCGEATTSGRTCPLVVFLY
jgi:hypothetical protein